MNASEILILPTIAEKINLYVHHITSQIRDFNLHLGAEFALCNINLIKFLFSSR